MSLNRLIALGGRGVKSPAERFLDTKGQMEQGRLRQAQEQTAYQTMDLRRQDEQRAKADRQVKMLAPLAKTVLQADDPATAYKQALTELPQYGVDVSKLPPGYSQELVPVLNSIMVAGGLELDEQFTETYKGGQPVSQKSSKTGRVYAHPEAPTKAEEGGPHSFSKTVKPISDTERRNMGKEFEIAGMLDKLEDDYKEEYSGFMSTNVAELAVAAGRRGIKYEDMAGYMTEYQEWKNLVRNSLFGSQLTKPEMTEFERQTINPAYKSEHNRKILKRQKELLARGKKRAIVALKAKGWTDEMISEFEGSYEGDSGELTPEEMQELEMRESIIRQQPDSLGKVSRNPPVSR